MTDQANNRCDDCGKIWKESELQEIKNLQSRVDAGGQMPSGQCPGCGALCYELGESEDLTPVLFRVDRAKKDGQDVTAVFPTIPADNSGRLLSCFAHIGQHSGCSMDWLRTTRPARVEEYADLKNELESAPYRYRLKIYQRVTPAHQRERLAQSRL